MKKTLIAIAALAATGAFAQSTVTIDGVVDAGYVNYNMKGAQVGGIDRNLTATSQINFRVASDLGGGLKATWRSETDFVPTSNNANQGTVGNVANGTNATVAGANLTNGTQATFMNGEQELALAGGYGRIGFGAINNGSLISHLYAQPFGTAIGSGFKATSGSAVTAAVRNDNTLQYTTPVFLGGVKLNYINRKGQNGSVSPATANYNASLGAQQQASVNSLAAYYNAGPVNFIATRDIEDATFVNTVTAATGATTLGNRNTFTALGGNYTFGATTVYAGWQTNKAVAAVGGTVTDRSATILSAQYVMGVNTFMGTVHRANNALAGTTSSLLGFGYEYALSKTTAVTARYERIADQAGFASVAGYNATAGVNDRTRMGVGLRLGF